MKIFDTPVGPLTVHRFIYSGAVGDCVRGATNRERTDTGDRPRAFMIRRCRAPGSAAELSRGDGPGRKVPSPGAAT